MLRASLSLCRRMLRFPTAPHPAGSRNRIVPLWKVLAISNSCYCTAPVEPKTKSKSLLDNIMREHGDQSKLELDELHENSWRRMKTTLIIFGISFTCIGSYLVFELGKPKLGTDGKLLDDEFSHMPVVQQYLYRAASELNYYKRLINEPSRDKLLPDVMPYPYYQPPYTLVLELTDVLVHPDWTYNTGWRFKKRPGIDEFLESLHGIYEVVVYTAEMGMTVFPIIEALDPKNIITYKLVRDATHFVDGHHVKDLDRLNRDLSKVIVIDWNAASTKFHQDNVLRIPRWEGNDDDTTLSDLASFLKVIAHSEINDVRDVLRNYKNFDDPLIIFRERQRQLATQLENQKSNIKR